MAESSAKDKLKEWQNACPLRLWRKSVHGWTRLDHVAKTVGCSVDMVSRWELGKSVPNKDRFLLLYRTMANKDRFVRNVFHLIYKWWMWIESMPDNDARRFKFLATLVKHKKALKRELINGKGTKGEKKRRKNIHPRVGKSVHSDKRTTR